MTDEAIILDTLKFIRQHTIYISKRFTTLKTTIWHDYNQDRQEFLENRLLEGILMGLNPEKHEEVELTAQAKIYIENKNEKLEKDFLKYIKKQRDIKWFMVNHFIKPDPKSPLTVNETDNGVNFLKSIKAKGLITYDDGDVDHINTWFVDDKPPTIRRWFDTTDRVFGVTLIRQPSFLFRLLNSRLVLYTKKYAVIAGIKIWKIFVAIAIFLLGCYLSSGDHFDKTIIFLKSHLK